MARSSVDDLKTKLSEAQREELERRLRRASTKRTTIPKVAGAREYPLSFAQERLWLHQQMHPESVAYNRPVVIELAGEVNFDDLTSALNSIIRRHASLRTGVTLQDGVPVAKLHDKQELEIERADFSQSEDCSEAEEDTHEFFSWVLSLGDRTEVAARLLRLSDRKHRLLLNFHHFTFDAWSQTVLVRELAENYRQITNGKTASQKPLEIQYADYARWERSAKRERDLSAGREYWKNQCAEFEPLVIRTDSPDRTSSDETAAAVHLEIPIEKVDQLQAIARQEQTTLFTVLLSVFETLLHRYTGQKAFVTGIPAAIRSQPETEPLIGLFINTLPIRCDIDPNVPFNKFLASTHQTVVAGLKHKEVPLQHIVEDATRPGNSLGGPKSKTLFNTLFVFENFGQNEFDCGKLKMQAVDYPCPATPIDLSLELASDTNGMVTGWFHYRTCLWNEASIERFRTHYLNLLDSVIRSPGKSLGELALLSADEETTLLEDWSRGEHGLHDDRSICEIILQQAVQNPQKVAITSQSDRGELTYDQLATQSETLAKWLRKRNVQQGDIVMLVGDRSIEVLTAMFGIMRAGGAFVICDPETPSTRIHQILEDCQPKIILAGPGDEERLRHEGLQVESVETLLCSKVDAEFELPTIAPDSPAYVIFTSGSTGKPNGVVIPHRSLRTFCESAIGQYGYEPTDRVLQFASLTFDACIEEIFPTWCCGASIVLRSNKLQDSFTSFVDACQTMRVSIASLPTAYWHMLVESMPEDKLQRESDLRLVILGGEAVSGSHVTRWRKAIGNRIRLLNTYGPTEATVVTVFSDLTHAKESSFDRYQHEVPIGRPFPNVRAYVLDGCMNPVPVGVPGELFLGGESLASGYLNREALTAERFIRDPFAANEQDRLYRTGDLVYWQNDGQLGFVGRVDDQLKIRGFRIEPLEIETVLEEVPEIARAVVVARDDESGEKQLVAYVKPANGEYVDVQRVSGHCQQRMPAYMMPAAIDVLTDFPMTASQKINRKALPAPTTSMASGKNQVEVPHSPFEEQLLAIWNDVLRKDSIHIHDNFYFLGGHSLQAVQIASRVSNTFQIELPIRTLFDHPTVAQLATAIHRIRTAASLPPPIPLSTIDRTARTEFPMSYGQRRFWFLEQLEGNVTASNMRFAWFIRGDLNREGLRRALDKLVERHEALRTVYVGTDAGPMQRIQDISRFEISFEDLRKLSRADKNDRIEQLRERELKSPFDLATDLMMRATLLQLSDAEHYLMVTKHHIATDGWSLRVFWQEIEYYYDLFSENGETELPELPAQYVDYSQWQLSEEQSHRHQKLLEHWVDRMRGLDPLELPTDFSRPMALSNNARRHTFLIEGDLNRKLRDAAERENVTLNMFLLAAFQILLSRYSGQQDIATATPISGRNDVAVERMIGFFVNTLAMRVDLAGDPTFRDVLQRVRDAALDAYDHQDLPFERLIEELQPERQLGRSPLVQVLFQLLTFSVRGLDLNNLEMSRDELTTLRSRYDLEMHLFEEFYHLRGSIVFSTDLFRPETISRMAGHFCKILEHAVGELDLPVSEIPILADDEQRQLTIEWNQTERELPEKTGLHQLFESRVDLHPNEPAVVFDIGQLTYQQLDDQAEEFAAKLRSMGAGGTLGGSSFASIVAIQLERSADLVIAILGALKAGAAWLPLDVDSPHVRTKTILRESRANVLVRRDNKTGAMILEAVATEGDNESNTNPPESNVDPAYVIYTSGSTGKPKGVVIPHIAAINLVTGVAEILNLKPGDRFLGVASPTFDIFVAELFLPLITGGTAILVGREAARSPDVMKASIERWNPEFIQATPATWQILCESKWSGTATGNIISTGEALSPELGKKLLPKCRQLWDLYGPTEATIWATANLVEKDDQLGSIGRPIANMQAYVLDERMQPVPVGVYGELYLGGIGLATGYLNRPDLTAERFVANPFDETGETRLYRTGDRVRWNGDGTIEFRGRFDHQLKLRGYRIEAGEIEAAVTSHPSIQHCVVILREDQPGDRRLVAYYLAKTGLEVSAIEIIDRIREQLPEYMVPSAFVFLDKYPLTASGKVDRKRLPQPDSRNISTVIEFVEPHNKMERAITNIWAEILSVKQVGVNDNFFELGGHSLLVARMIGRVNQTFDSSLPIAAAFRFPTVAQIASQLKVAKQANSNGEPSGSVRHQSGHFLKMLQEGTQAGTIVCVGGRVQSILQHIPDTSTVLGLSLDGVQARPYLGLEVSELAERYADELLEANLDRPLVIMGFCYGGLLAYALACELHQRGTTEFDLVMLEPSTRIDSQLMGDKPVAAASTREATTSQAPSIVNRIHWYSQAISFRLQRYWTDFQIATGQEIPIDRLFDRYLTANLQRVRNYKPAGRYAGQVHLLGGENWLKRHQAVWIETLLGKPPVVHSLGDQTAHEFTDMNVPANAWTDLVCRLSQPK